MGLPAWTEGEKGEGRCQEGGQAQERSLQRSLSLASTVECEGQGAEWRSSSLLVGGHSVCTLGGVGARWKGLETEEGGQ